MEGNREEENRTTTTALHIGIIPTTGLSLDLSCPLPDVDFHSSVEVLAAPRREHFFLIYFTNTGKSRGYETVFSSLAYSFKNKVPHPTYCSKWRCLLFLKLYSKKPASSAVLNLHQDNFQ